MSRHYIIPIFVPHYGCPHDCVFCNQKKITGLSTDTTPEEVEKIIEDHLMTFKPDSTIEVAFYGGSFTAIDIEIQKKLLSIPYRYKKEGRINGIRLSTRPDSIDEVILTNLRNYSVDTIELGVQSLDECVLYESGRGHDSNDVYRASKLIKDFGFNLGLQMMIGLPSDTIEKSINTCKEFIKLNPYCVRIYPTLIIKETYLEELFLDKRYKPLSIEEAIDISSVLLMIFQINNIDVIRIGLQPTENIQLGKDVVAGPFHPAFRQLVESNIFRLLLGYYFKTKKIDKDNKTLVIESNNKKISSIAGQQSTNIKYLKHKYKFNKIKIYGKDLDIDYIGITINEFYDKINMKSLMESYLKENSII
ncbi:radical SAM protein [Tissierella pigra]|uniref:Radical SAM protein n=1 Tax=Tissierella pigra TaxID=2607614 RepID=A0A6N7XW81_9FIRM|nr:radical SAM protein [Tissierella pigra]MBU5426504.1 radical SAM protein [Tissierella pigra]MSU00050.1 radical SAM protein [Tissierella pigra]